MKVKFKVFGYNQLRLLEKISARQIKLFDIQKQDNYIIFYTKSNNCAFVIAFLDKLCYNYEVERTDYKVLLCKNISTILIIVAILLLTVYFDSQVLQLRVEGATSSEIITIAKENNIKLYDTKKLETVLQVHYSAKSVQLKRQGIVLFVKIIPRDTQPPTEEFDQIIAKYEGVVAKIVVYSGTARKKVGDKVSVGDVLIDGVIELGDEKTQVEASGQIEIKATLVYCENIPLVEKTKHYTGREQTTVGIDFIFHYFAGKVQNIEFEEYETEVVQCYLSTVFPIKRVQTIYKEIEFTEQVIDFEANKQRYIQTAIDNLQTNEGFTLFDYEVEIEELDDSKNIWIKYYKLMEN